jgi:hypothetical protein
MTGNSKYLRAAIRCAAALAKNFKPGDEKNSPWPFRCLARNGALSPGKGMSPYSANVVEPVMLFDELMRIGQGDVSSYKLVRQVLLKHLTLSSHCENLKTACAS